MMSNLRTNLESLQNISPDHFSRPLSLQWHFAFGMHCTPGVRKSRTNPGMHTQCSTAGHFLPHSCNGEALNWPCSSQNPDGLHFGSPHVPIRCTSKFAPLHSSNG